MFEMAFIGILDEWIYISICQTVKSYSEILIKLFYQG